MPALLKKSTGTAGTDNAVNFASSSFGNYSETDFWGTLKSSGGDLAGGSENLSVFWNGNDFAETLKTNCNSDRMPDKGKLNCVIENHACSRVSFEINYGCPIENELAHTLKCGTAPGTYSGVIERNDVAATLTAAYADKMGIENQHNPLVQECYEWHSQDLRAKKINDGCGSTISAGMGMGGANMTTPMLVQECYALDSVGSNSMKSSNPNSGFHKEEIAKTLDTSAPYPEKNQGGNVIVDAVAIAENVIGRKVENGGNGVGAQEELAYTQNASGVMGVCTKGNGDAFESEVHTSLSASGGGQAGQGYPCVRNSMTVRRLLPIECERLMGFQDNWTQIPWRGKPAEECPDAPRYKACGNSMCVNVMQWIGEQIERVEKEMNEK